jgi:hypothetical protein
MGGLPVERLRQYLRQLPPASRALLIGELERALLRGEEIPGGDAVLQEVRSALRASGEQVPRIGSPARLFFRPVEPFLVDDAPRKTEARIARTSLEPIWTWICRDLVPEEAKTFADAVSSALVIGDTALGDRLTAAFQDRVAERCQQVLAAAASDDKARRRLAVQVGTAKAIDDVRELAQILERRDALARIGDRLPGHIHNLADAALDAANAALDSVHIREECLLRYAFILVMSRLAASWQVIRLAIKGVQSDDAARIASSPYVMAVTIVFADIERMVGELKADLKRGGNIAVTSLLKCIHDAVRGVRTELDLPVDSAWGRQLAAIRAEISSALKLQIESAPSRVRRLLRPRPAGEIQPNSILDAGDVAEVESLIELVGACRKYASELAVSEMTTRTYGELHHYLDTGTQTLLDGLRAAGAQDRLFRQSQVDAAVRFCAQIFGREYASLLAKAAEVAGHHDRKAAARA